MPDPAVVEPRVKQLRLPFPPEERDERPDSFPPPLTLDGRCEACGCHWARCQYCGVWWYGRHSCADDA